MSEDEQVLRHRLTDSHAGSNTNQSNSGVESSGLTKAALDTASEDFLCSCCYDLMVQPTTLTCGHSFCRLCIANWYLTSKKTECPQCRSAWTGNPQINITLRNLLKKMYPDAIAERETEILTADAKEKIAKFDSTVSSTIESGERTAQGQGFCGGICLAGSILCVIYLSWYWQSSDKDLLVHKPLTQWTVEDVSNWLIDMGPWTQGYVETVHNKSVAGNLLLGLDEDTIDSIFSISDPLHRKAVLNSINVIKQKGVKPPSNLWEFKALQPGWALFLLYGLKDYPRSVLLYLYMFEYKTMFLPFIHVVCPVSSDAPRYDFSVNSSDPTSLQWAEFLPKFLVLPYWLIGEFAWDWLDIHWWTARFILLNCFVMTALELNCVVMYLREERQFITLQAEVKKMLKSYLSMGLFVIVWPIVPSFVCDCFFYVAMYFSPYQAAEQIFIMWRR